ncbi:contact-dependent growth inhibition system immunity protein [Tatumella ptyseos]|uniref:contact-dependent growth inhibition system immunity protein n=1 Tax=Tatumella ptyseos TaxID=82987 RepID=UPI0026EE1B95|nr:contact-dependent growth inhibition system immunity protein [Tatumella ptyseos]WKX27657.1 contact-dependent growth inhibition system immunity protein [Tatumella ptyseos]
MKFENIAYLLGAYFHQDWFYDAPSPDDVIRNFIERESTARILALKQELDQLLDSDKASISDSFIIDNNGYYDPHVDGLTVYEWLKKIQMMLI